MTRVALRLPRMSSDLGAALALLIGSGFAAVLQGQDANLDLYRYRFYIGYAFVHGRLDLDLAPAALGTYLNPVLDAFHYLGIAHLPPRVFGFLMGSFQGLNAVVVLLLARCLLPVDRGSRLLGLLAALLAASGPTARSLLGTTLGDTTVSVPALLALLLLVRGQASPNRGSALYLMGAGFLGGAAMGLKLTMAPALVALASLVLLGLVTMRIPMRAALAALAGSVLGYLTVAGYWCWQLWERFGNPIFPFANQIFRSPFMPAKAIRDSRWAAHSPLDFLSPPFNIALGMTERLQEIPFRDARFLLVLLAALTWAALRLRRKRPPLPLGQRSLLVYFLISYAVWGIALYYYRYAAVLEFLTPLVLAVLVQACFPKLARSVLIASTILVLLTSSVGSWGRLAFGERWFYVRLPPQAHEPDSLVLVDSSLSSFLIPYFPAATRFAGLEGVGSSRFEELLAARIASHRGNLFWLVSRGRPAPSESPERFGLAVSDDCGPIRTGEGKWALCRVVGPSGPRM
jgi:hypothetical protein